MLILCNQVTNAKSHLFKMFIVDASTWMNSEDALAGLPVAALVHVEGKDEETGLQSVSSIHCAGTKSINYRSIIKR